MDTITPGNAAAACRDADIIIEATRLERPEVLIPADAVKPGALIVTAGNGMHRRAALPGARRDDGQCGDPACKTPLME